MSFSRRFGLKPSFPDGLIREVWDEIVSEYRRLQKNDKEGLQNFMRRLKNKFKGHTRIIEFIEKELQEKRKNISKTNFKRYFNNETVDSVPSVPRSSVHSVPRASAPSAPRASAPSIHSTPRANSPNVPSAPIVSPLRAQAASVEKHNLRKLKNNILNLACQTNNRELLNTYYNQFNTLNKTTREKFNTLVAIKKSSKLQKGVKDMQNERRQQNQENRRGPIHRRTGYPATHILMGKPIVNYFTVDGKGPFHRVTGLPFGQLFAKRNRNNPVPVNSHSPSTLTNGLQHNNAGPGAGVGGINLRRQNRNPVLNPVINEGFREIYYVQDDINYEDYHDLSNLYRRQNLIKVKKPLNLDKYRYCNTNVRGEGFCSIWAIIFGYLLNNNNTFENTKISPFLNGILVSTNASRTLNDFFRSIENRDYLNSFLTNNNRNNNGFRKIHACFIMGAIHLYCIALGRGIINIQDNYTPENLREISQFCLDYNNFNSDRNPEFDRGYDILYEYMYNLNRKIILRRGEEYFNILTRAGETRYTNREGIVEIPQHSMNMNYIQQLLGPSEDTKQEFKNEYSYRLKNWRGIFDGIFDGINRYDYISDSISVFLSFFLDVPILMLSSFGTFSYIYSGNLDIHKNLIHISNPGGSHYNSFNRCTLYSNFESSSPSNDYQGIFRSQDIITYWWKNMWRISFEHKSVVRINNKR